MIVMRGDGVCVSSRGRVFGFMINAVGGTARDLNYMKL